MLHALKQSAVLLERCPPVSTTNPAGINKSRLEMLHLMPEAFVLFKTEPTHEREVYLSLTEHEGVAEVHALYGEFDLLVRISSPTSKELSHLLMESFRRIKGVKETQTLIAVEA
jgi:DNA-binding Lrp family transcriptional regulator